MISVSGIQADLRDVSYYINKKEGFPSIKDTGVMDIFLGGEGFSFKIAASNAQKKDRQNFVKLDKVSVKIDDIDIKLKKSKHKVLFSVFKPLLFRTVRLVLQKVVEKQIREAFTKGDAFAYEVHQEAKRAKEQAAQEIKENPKDAPNTYNRYMSAFRARMEERKRQAQQTAEQQATKRDTKVQTTATLSGSLFPDIKLPGGITTKATEYEEIAKKGERWESPIFSIGSASESTDIPKPDAITRKPHSATEARLRDRNATGGAAGDATNGTNLTNGGTAVANGQAKHYDSTLRNDANGTATQGASTVSGTTVFNPQTA